MIHCFYFEQVFEAFGQVELVQLPVDETGHCKGYGFVQVSTICETFVKLLENAALKISMQHSFACLTTREALNDIISPLLL